MEIIEIPLTDVGPPLFDLRETVGDLTNLKASLQKSGQLHSILVRPTTGKHKWQVVDGYRRYVAALDLGWATIKAEARELGDKEALELALMANIQRQNLNPVEEAEAFRTYVSEKGWGSSADLAERLGVSPIYISRRLGLLGLSESIVLSLRKGEITTSHGEELGRVEKKEVAEQLADIIKETGLTRDQTRVAIDYVKAGLNPDIAASRALDVTGYNDSFITPEKTVKHFDAGDVARDSIVLSLRKALANIDLHLSNLTDAEQKEWIEAVRYPLHELINASFKLQKKHAPTAADVE